LLLTLSTACFLALVVFRFAHEEFIVDRCLSAHHGSFNYSDMICDVETNHPYVPYQVRHPRDERNFELSLLSFVALLSGYLYVRVHRRKK